MAACCERFHWTPDAAADMTPLQLQTVMTINDPEKSGIVVKDGGKALTNELDRLQRGK